jgi:uncharacterized protein YndB with AHSA1/START domain
LLQDGVEAAGSELDSEDVGLAFEQAGEFAGVNSGDLGVAALEDDVDAGMRQSLWVGGRVVAEVPDDEPVIFDEGHEVRWREMAGVMDSFGGAGEIQDAASGVHVWELLSRFSNHERRPVIMLLREVRSVMSELIVRDSIAVAASVETVWRVLTESEFIRQYMFGCRVETDWAPGSRLLWKGEPNDTLYVEGDIVAIEKPYRLEYTVFAQSLGIEDVPENYLTVTYALRAGDGGGSVLEVTQGDYSKVGLGQKRYQDTVAGGGWGVLLEKIKGIAEGIDSGG